MREGYILTMSSARLGMVLGELMSKEADLVSDAIVPKTIIASRITSSSTEP